VSRNTNARGAFLTDQGGFTGIGTLETPIEAVLARCNKDSANLYAESLAKRLAAKATGKPGSWEGSRASIGAWLQKIGIPEEQFKLDDGCGLSRNNAISAEGMVRILAADYAAGYRKTFINSLAVGGEDGTLEKRFKGMEGRVHAKSGFINGVSTLSGYLQSKSGDWYAFSILLNRISGGKPIHERIVRALDNNVR
jgi:D-alanyl-D-alanine carboxypeptidase/D-alanyl-D-alanine-endopeptidase (penicillin-binding protein 4)